MNGESETWLPVVGYEDVYQVSSLGRIYSIPRPCTKGGLLAVKLGKRGYPAVTLVRHGKQATHELHRLVAAAFLGPKPSGTEVRHRDGDSLNPCASNLLYGTRSENNRDTVRHGTHPKTQITRCPQGHPYDEANTMVYRGHRYCRACHNSRSSRAKRHPGWQEWKP